MNEDYPKLAKIIFDYIKEEVKISKQFGHLIILNILSCKNCYKKHIDMKDLQNIIIQFYQIWEENEKKEIKENNKKIANVKNIYTPIFGVYNNIEQLVKKNLTKLDNIKELYQEEGKIKWNQLLLNKRKNEQIKNSELSKNNTKWLEYFSEINFINDIVNISDILRTVPRERRENCLKDFILYLNKEYLPSYIYNPLSSNSNNHEDILLRIDEKFSYPISTKERVPCQLLFEYYSPNNNLLNEEEKEKNNVKEINNNKQNIRHNEKRFSAITKKANILLSPNSINLEINSQIPKIKSEKILLVNPKDAKHYRKSETNISLRNNIYNNNYIDNNSELLHIQNSGIFGKFLFSELEEKILNNSKYKKNPNFTNRKIISSIIKGGDELRQDFFISQVLYLFNDIFKKEKLKIHLLPFKVISNGTGGFLQTIINSTSMSKINKISFFEEDNDLYENEIDNNDSNLKNYFIYKFGKETFTFENAINNFISSFTGYSLICYFLEIKDRNNGNILIDNNGNIIHIDFGFLLNKTPGNIKFEQAPFKLTNDFIELMGGTESKYFISFQDLFFKGFQCLRKKFDTIVLLVELFCDIFHDLNSFHDKKDIMKNLKEKFWLTVNNDEELMKKCNELIFNSIDNWRTKAYDGFQKYCVGVN